VLFKQSTQEEVEENEGVNASYDYTHGKLTGLVHQKGKTQNSILKAFLMQGDFTVFITVNEDSVIFIEPFYSIDDVGPVCEMLELCDISCYTKYKLVADRNR
jgi:hypothetical protein